MVQAQPVGNLRVVLMNKNDNVDEVVRNVQQQNMGAHNNIANLVETIMAQKWPEHWFT